MKVLFVSSGNSHFGIIPFIKSQGESIRTKGIELEYFIIRGKGIKGYLKNTIRLRKHIKANKYDIIHAHYSYTAFCTSIAKLGKSIPLVVSLMGSDTESSKLEKFLIKLFNRLFWSKLIVKSQSMHEKINIKNVKIIPNGVDTTIFKPIDKLIAKENLKLDPNKKYILFAADPSRYSKNYELAEESINKLNNSSVSLLIVKKANHIEIASYLNAADILILTSRYEGSPNIIKEAMSCNCPIVTTEVGDVRWVIDNTDGCFITKHDSNDICDKLKQAIKFTEEKGRTNGKVRIEEIELDSGMVADKIINLYREITKIEK